MAFGYTARNSTNSVLVSDRSYNTVYAGKAVFQEQFRTFFGGGYSISGSGNFALLMQFRRFRFDAGGAEVIPFMYNPASGFGAIVYTTRVGTAYDFYVVTQENVVPTIYCFIKSTSSGKSGWGLSLFDASGKTTFTTGDNILRPKAVYSAVTAGSSVQYGDPIGSGAAFPFTSAAVRSNAPFNAVPAIAKAAILYNSYGTAECVSKSFADGAYWESVARFDYGSKILQTHWGYVSNGAGANVQTPQRDEMAIVIDGAEYD